MGMSIKAKRILAEGLYLQPLRLISPLALFFTFLVSPLVLHSVPSFKLTIWHVMVLCFGFLPHLMSVLSLLIQKHFSFFVLALASMHNAWVELTWDIKIFLHWDHRPKFQMPINSVVLTILTKTADALISRRGVTMWQQSQRSVYHAFVQAALKCILTKTLIP